jgi:hypothetical protein
LDFPRKGREHLTTQQQEAITMGDKSPKAKDKSRKQDTADKNQKAQVAKAKQPLSSAVAGKKPR